MIIDFGKLPFIREKHRGQTIIFCSGVFDLAHAGHVLFLEDCKKQGDILVVEVGSDEAVKRDKGETRPVLNEHLRMKMVDSLKVVDYVFKDQVIQDELHPLSFIDMVFERLQPDVYVVNNDAFDISYRKHLVKKHGIRLVICNRTCPPEFEEISTTKLIQKIKGS